MINMFAVVTFEDKSTSEVPTNWLIDSEDVPMSWWPPSNTKNLSSLISKRIEPNKSTWQKLNITLERICSKYENFSYIIQNARLLT